MPSKFFPICYLAPISLFSTLIIGCSLISPPSTAPAASTTLSTQQYAFIANNFLSSVSVCAIANGRIGTCATPSTGNSTFNSPWGLVFDNQNNLYVANDGGNNISICPVTNSNNIGTCTTSNGNNTFSGPWGVAFDSHNNLFVANSTNHTVSVCPVSLGVIGTCNVITQGVGLFNNPWGITIHNNYLYVANNGSSYVDSSISICPISAAGAVTGSCVTRTDGGKVVWPSGIAFDNNNNLYIANAYSYSSFNYHSAILVCPNVTGNIISSCIEPTETFTFSANPVSPTYNGGGITFDANYNLYVIQNSNTVKACSISSGTIGTCATGGSSLSSPLDIVIH